MFVVALYSCCPAGKSYRADLCSVGLPCYPGCYALTYCRNLEYMQQHQHIYLNHTKSIFLYIYRYTGILLHIYLSFSLSLCMHFYISIYLNI